MRSTSSLFAALTARIMVAVTFSLPSLIFADPVDDLVDLARLVGARRRIACRISRKTIVVNCVLTALKNLSEDRDSDLLAPQEVERDSLAQRQAVVARGASGLRDQGFV